MATTTHYRDQQSLQVNHRMHLFRPFAWLVDAGRDFLAHPLASMAYGALVAVLGALVLAYQRHPLFIASAILGFLVIGPVFAAGLCELSRRRARGEVVNFDTSLQVLVRCRQPLVKLVWALLVCALVVAGFATWLLGLVVIFPLLGHATWRIYEDCGRQER
ncbi:DUF2189 domain-containing protein [Haliea sp.]